VSRNADIVHASLNYENEKENRWN